MRTISACSIGYLNPRDIEASRLRDIERDIAADHGRLRDVFLSIGHTAMSGTVNVRHRLFA